MRHTIPPSPAQRSNARWGALFLLLGLSGFLLWGAGAQRAQETLARQVLRLHVVAHSDAAEDQALKLLVRDRILTELTSLLADESDARTACELVAASLPLLGAAGGEEARRQGCDYPVSAALGVFAFPSRDYGSFSLPAGDYTALRVVIGDGAGENWWCVVFPPLCMEAVSGPSDVTALGLDEGSAALITPGETGAYELRFKSVELWQRFKELWD